MPSHKLVCVVPPTNDQGSAKFTCKDSWGETCAQNALWEYNKMREHDGQSALNRMPKGTRYLSPYHGN